MKIFAMTAAVLLLVLAAPNHSALAGSENIISKDDFVAHSGGCRKDSPPGKCCHAGSKPFHCH